MKSNKRSLTFLFSTGAFFAFVYGTIILAPEIFKSVAIEIAEKVYASDQYDYAKAIATGNWQDILRKKAMEEAGLPPDLKAQQGQGYSFDGNFGGQIIFTFPCICNAKTLFLMKPIRGKVGPYVVHWFPPYLRQFHMVIPGNHVLGRSTIVPSGFCSIYVLIWCFNYSAYDVQAVTGMGTSATP